MLLLLLLLLPSPLYLKRAVYGRRGEAGQEEARYDKASSGVGRTIGAY